MDTIPTDLTPHQFVFIDFVSKAGMDVPDLEELRKQKESRFKGVNTNSHEAYVIIEVRRGNLLLLC